MKNLFILISFTLLLAGLQACRKPSCLESAGATTLAERKTEPFHQIELNDDLDLVLTQGTAEKVSVETGANLQPNITAQIQNGVLVLKNTTSCNWLRNPSEKTTVYVTFKALDKIHYNGSGHVRSADTLRVPRLDIFTDRGAGNVELTLDAGQVFAYIYNESADYTLRGKADECWTYANARATIDFSDLAVRKYVMSYGALKDTYIQVSEEIDLEIFYKGNVYYRGDPRIKTTYHSTGRLIKAP